LESESHTWLWDEISSGSRKRSKPLRVCETLRAELGEASDASRKWILQADVAIERETSRKVLSMSAYATGLERKRTLKRTESA
jgi:glyoxylate carboligase